MSIHDPNEQQRLDPFEAEQADRVLERTAQLETELIVVEQKLHSLRAFMAEARSHEGNMLEWLSGLKHQDYPGKDLGLSITLDLETED